MLLPDGGYGSEEHSGYREHQGIQAVVKEGMYRKEGGRTWNRENGENNRKEQ